MSAKIYNEKHIWRSGKMWRAKIRFWDRFEGEKFVVEIKAADKESLRKQWREELKAYVAEGYEFLGVEFEEVKV